MNALEMAKNINQLNCERKQLTNQDMKIVRVLASTPNNLKANTLVIFDPRLHSALVGIEASRLVEKYNKPTLIIGHQKGDPKNIFRGSGRSIPEFNLFTAMIPLKADMISFGGHPQACGFSIKGSQINKLRTDLENNATKLGHVNPTIKPDFFIEANQINNKLIAQLEKLEPFGENNEQPIFDVKLNQIYNIQTMGNGKHLSFYLNSKIGSVKVTAFGMGQLYSELKKHSHNVEIVGTVGLNHYRGYTDIQFNAKYITHYQPKLTRQMMIKLYCVLHYLAKNNQKMTFDTITEFSSLTNHTIKLGLKVFSELNFINKKANTYILNANPVKKSLTASKTFKLHA